MYLAVVSIVTACDAVKQHGIENPVRSDLRIHYVEHGRGEPVVLVHGFSQTHEAWLQTPLFDALARDYRVIAVDLRGHGNSDKPQDPASYGRNLETDLVDLLDRLEIDRAHFIGFSLGASVVGGLLVSNQERVQTATMGSGFFATWQEEEEDFARWTEERGRSGERYPWEPANQDFAALAAVIRGIRYASVSDAEIAAIQTPTLIAYGSIEIDSLPESRKRRLSGLPESIRTLIIEGADHDSPKAAILSDEFSRAVVDLIASHPIG